MKFQSICASVLAAACSFCVHTARAATTSVSVSSLKNFISGEPQYINGTLVMDENFDLGSGRLILKGVTGISAGKAFSGATGSVLDIEITGDIDLGQKVSLLTGDLKFIKRGDSSLNLPQNSTHTGGTEVFAGVLSSKTSTTKDLGKMTPFGAYGTEIVINGGTLLVRGYNSWKDHYSINLNGGRLQNNTAYTGSNTLDAEISVTAESTIDTLEAAMAFKPASISGTGRINIVGTGLFKVGTNLSMKDIGLSVAAPFALGSYDLEVNDYEVMAETAPTGTGMIKVNGIFKPTTANFSSAVLLNGSTIDLAGWEDKPVVNADGTQVAFAEAATITLDVGDRVVNAGDTVLVWAEGTEAVAYEGRLFKLVGQNVASGLAVEATAEGVKAVQASQDIVTATWKGEGEVSNWKDPANWICYNAADAIIPNGVPGDDLTVVFTGDVSDVPFGNGFPFAGARLTDAYLSANVDWSAFDLGKITPDSVLDVGENTLKVARDSGVTSCVATFASTVEGGVFEIEVAKGASFTNATINLEGAISLKKTGLGALVLAKEGQTYTGKTMIEEGTLVCGTENVTNAKTFGEGKEIDLASGTILDPAGSTYWGNVTINMNGGMISNTVEQTGLSSDKYNATITNPFSPILNLNVSSILATSESFNFQGEVIAANDSELTIEIPADKNFLWDASNAKDFTLNVTGGGYFKYWHKSEREYSNVKGLVLYMKNASFNLYQASGSGYPATFGVAEYIASSEVGAHTIGGVLEVHNRFFPANDYFFGCKMLDGSIVDLSGKDANETWSITSSATGKNTVEFADDANVTIKLGNRTPTKGTLVVRWTEDTKPAENVKFSFEKTEGTPEELIVSANGIMYGRAAAPEAIWKGSTSKDLSDPNNWEGELNANIRATFKDDVSGLFASADFVCGSVLFDKASLEDGNANFGWLDLNKVTDDSELDLKGHTLDLAVSGATCTSAGKITDSVGGGTLNLTVADGTYTNETFSLGGGLKFVKKGTGTFVAAKAQEYTGETEVETGVLVTGIEAVNADNAPFGKGYKVVVGENGILDAAGSYGWVGYTIDMNGGTITNTIDRTGYADGKPAANRNMTTSFSPTLNLLQDALIITTNGFNFCGTVLANNHELEINIGYGQYFVWKPASATNLTLNVSKGGYFCTYKEDMPYAKQTNMIFKCNAALNLLSYSGKGSMPVKDYYALYADATNEGQGSLKVYGTFYPVHEKYFRGCVMMDGSAIDLSKKTKVWSITSSSNYGNGAPNTVTFADNATVTIDVHGRKFKNNTQIVSWTTKPENVTFIIDTASKVAGYKLETRDDGIYVTRSGVLLIFK